MKTKNKIILFALCLVLSVALIACGGNKNKPDGDTTFADEPSIENEDTSAEVGTSAEGVNKEDSSTEALKTETAADPCLTSHDLYEVEAAVAASCTADGKSASLACKNCSYTEGGERIPAGHDLVHHEAKSASCTEAGWNAYDTCARCDYISREIIGKLGHTYNSDGVCDCGAEQWVIPSDAAVHYATLLSDKSPSIDGVIDTGEYGEAIRVDAPRPIDLASRVWKTESLKSGLASKYMDFYFSYDEDNIYIAIFDVGPDYVNNGDSYTKNDVAFRHNYRFEFGFDLADTSSYFMFEGGSTSTAWTTLKCYDGGSEVKHSFKSYNLVSDSMIQKFKIDKNGKLGDYVAYGDIGTGNGNENYTDGTWAVVMEFKLSKAELVNVINEVYGTEYEELSGAMWFSATSRGYKAKQNNLEDIVSTQNVRWIGQGADMLDLIVFGDEKTAVSVADPHPTQNYCPEGHLLASHKALAPTYDAVGHEAYESCDACGYTTYKEIPRIEKIFRTGYARVDITPNVSEQNPLGNFTNVMNSIYATCVAVSDGEKTIIILSVDMKSMSTSDCDQIRARISKETGIPTDNVFISATHDHSVIAFGNNKKWRVESFRNIGDAAKEAIADLSDTELYMGVGKTTGMAWVRRYVNSSGKMFSVNPGSGFSDTTMRSVSEADDSLQTLRMVREDKKDIVLINWQGHLAHAVDMYPTSISSDMAHYIREGVESGDDDALVAYFAGASGNLNLNAPNVSLVEYSNESNPKVKNNYYVNVAKALADVILDTIEDDNLTRIEGGRIVFEKKTYAAAHKKDSAADVAAAQARLDAGGNDAGDRYMVVRNKSDSTTLRISAVAFGDFAFITVPYEMFDNNGLQVKEASPFKMTFVLTNSDGDYAYMPSVEAWEEYGGYETKATYFDSGVAERLVRQYCGLLDNLYDKYK